MPAVQGRPRRAGGLPGWTRRPLVPGAVLLVAALVSVAHGQPSPVDRALGVTIPVKTGSTTPSGIGPMTLVTGGGLVHYDRTAAKAVPVQVPPGGRVLQVQPCYRAHAVLVRFPSGRLVGYVVPRDGGLVRLGEARAIVPDANNLTVWLFAGGRVRQYRLDGAPTGAVIAVPRGYQPVGAVRGQVIASSAGEQAMTLVLPGAGRRRLLSRGQALDVASGVVLLRIDQRLAVLNLRTGELRMMPSLSAVQVTGPGTLAEDGAAFAVLGRVNDHARLIVGPIAPDSEAELQVVALDGGRPLPYPPAARWTDSGSVLAVRPDGQVVYFTPGERSGAVLHLDLPAVTGVANG
ncbi:MAG TPA: hypothetical protein VLJ59_12855 [Mycobacteriales bacterium]|nr:hypothetical protein [Mycobacteriales bacterium]